MAEARKLCRRAVVDPFSPFVSAFVLVLWQAAAMELKTRDLERLFSACFEVEYQTVLEGGGEEPLYIPSPSPDRVPHRVVYREDFVASALHEVAHWCLAGAERRTQEDYGYWYAPDGRDAAQQADFEHVESRPQALEWIFSDACNFDFHLSADNLAGGVGPSSAFEERVLREKCHFLELGLPTRATRFLNVLAEAQGAAGPGAATHRPRAAGSS